MICPNCMTIFEPLECSEEDFCDECLQVIECNECEHKNYCCGDCEAMYEWSENNGNT